MRIEITGETERLIHAALASGQFAPAEDFIAAMAQCYRAADNGTGLACLPKHLDVDVLATVQGVGPVQDFRELKASFWSESESVDAFVDEIKSLRDQDMPRTR